jgi:hypothetical protein
VTGRLAASGRSGAAVQIRGLEELRRKLAGMTVPLLDRFAAALYQEAEVEMTEAKRRTPVETGALRASGHVQPPVRTRRDVSVRLVFGGAAAGYAIYVHENMEALHNPGQAKFLESVVLESVPYLAARVAARVGKLGGTL